MGSPDLTTLAAAHRRQAKIMAFKLIVVATLVALASAGMPAEMMNMMRNMMQMNMGNMGNMGDMGHHQQQSGGCSNGNCQMPTGVDLQAYMEEQRQQQMYAQQQMAEKIKAQFEATMRSVTMRKHRFAMTMMTQFVSICACAKEATSIYQAMFVENAKILNMTNVVDMEEWAQKKPYDAKDLHEAKEIIFFGTLESMCTKMEEYMGYITLVEAEVKRLQGVVTPNPSG